MSIRKQGELTDAKMIEYVDIEYNLNETVPNCYESKTKSLGADFEHFRTISNQRWCY